MNNTTQHTKQILESKLLELSNPSGWRDAIAVRPSADPTDTTQQIVEREMASRELSRNASVVRELRAALNRVAEGTYSRCVDCGDSIAPRRLAAVPWAARCLSCQEDFETSDAQDKALAA